MILTCESVSVAYDDVVIEDVSFSVSKGDFLCIVGENGSGKTTLLKALLGLTPLKSGTIRKAENLQIGYVPQMLRVQHDFPASAEEIVRTGIRTRRPFLSRADKARVRENMELLDIWDKHRESFHALSGGQQQRVLLARALTASRGVLFLDEPTGGLDPLAISDFYALLKTLHRSGLTILMVSHDMDAATKLATSILHLDKTVKFFGAPDRYICSECGKRFLRGDTLA